MSRALAYAALGLSGVSLIVSVLTFAWSRPPTAPAPYAPINGEGRLANQGDREELTSVAGRSGVLFFVDSSEGRGIWQRPRGEPGWTAVFEESTVTLGVAEGGKLFLKSKTSPSGSANVRYWFTFFPDGARQ